MKEVINFNELPKNEQLYKLHHEGKELTSRQYCGFVIRLYTVCDQFVEVWFNPMQNLVEKIITLTQDDLILKYEKQIELP